MPRMARVVVPKYPHHVTQRGNRRQTVFFSAEDYATYIEFLANARDNAGVEIWAYCLMSNHVHLVVTPQDADGLRCLFSEAHRHYSRRVNFRENWRGHLWQERFHSFVMDERYLLATVRHVELNPVRAGLCDSAEDWAWSGVHAHLRSEDDQLVNVQPMLDRVSDWRNYLSESEDRGDLSHIQKHARTGRPLGDDRFVNAMETKTGRVLRPMKPGRKSKAS
jgi:putative transposase